MYLKGLNGRIVIALSAGLTRAMRMEKENAGIQRDSHYAPSARFSAKGAVDVRRGIVRSVRQEGTYDYFPVGKRRIHKMPEALCGTG